MTLSAIEVLDVQAELHQRLSEPHHGSHPHAEYIYWFGKSAAGSVAKAADWKASGEQRANYAWNDSEQHMQMMFYPYPVHRHIDAAAAWARDVGKSLFQARTYQVTAEMFDVVDKIYQRQEGEFRLEEPELPSPHGFCWLDKPLRIVDRWGRIVTERAFTWGLTTMGIQHPERGPMVVAAVRVSTWSHKDDFDEYSAEIERQRAGGSPVVGRGGILDEATMRQNLADLGSLALSHTLVVPLSVLTFGAGKGPHPEGAPGDYQPDSSLSWLHALWMIMEQEIVTSLAPRGIPRQARRRFAPDVKQPAVTIIQLRRSHSYNDQPGEHHEVDWSCRWLVQGHHRHIDSYEGERHHAVPVTHYEGTYCAVCWERDEAVRVTWVKSHLKGPDGMPLKASKQLYKLVR